MAMTLGQFKTACQEALAAKQTELGLTNSSEIGETDNGEAITDVIAAVLDTVRTVSPNNVKYPKIKT
jgi:hypothetical protein